MVVAGNVFRFVLHYRYWHVIQDGKVRTTPGKGVGFCFIPFFNFYLFFKSFYGLAKDMNGYCHENRIHTPGVSEPLSLLFCCSAISCGIPYVQVVGVFVANILGVILQWQFSRAAQAIMIAKQQCAEV